jgi:hypothetical protein
MREGKDALPENQELTTILRWRGNLKGARMPGAIESAQLQRRSCPPGSPFHSPLESFPGSEIQQVLSKADALRTRQGRSPSPKPWRKRKRGGFSKKPMS